MTNLHVILQELNNNGGATVYNSPLDVLNGKPMSINTRTSGYCVGDNRCSQIIPKLSETESEAIVQLTIAIAELWDRRLLCNTIGFWKDSASGAVYVDAVDVVDNVAEAMNLGASRSELAVWDIGLKREIRL